VSPEIRFPLRDDVSHTWLRRGSSRGHMSETTCTAAFLSFCWRCPRLLLPSSSFNSSSNRPSLQFRSRCLLRHGRAGVAPSSKSRPFSARTRPWYNATVLQLASSLGPSLWPLPPMWTSQLPEHMQLNLNGATHLSNRELKSSKLF
jgi:hypothetical protein